MLEEIVVTGIRGSLNQSLNIKRESAEFMDVISAEDIGKLPDQNVAEALQRVPGWQSKGAGEKEISFPCEAWALNSCAAP